MAKSEEMKPQEFVAIASRLEERLHNDPVVSDDIKQMASCIRVLAESMADVLDNVAELANRPAGRSINVNYGK